MKRGGAARDRDERDNMPDSLLYQAHQIGIVVHGYGLQLLKYLIPGADDDHQDEGYQEILLASSPPPSSSVATVATAATVEDGAGP
jgi:hypothetical protein